MFWKKKRENSNSLTIQTNNAGLSFHVTDEAIEQDPHKYFAYCRLQDLQIIENGFLDYDKLYELIRNPAEVKPSNYDPIEQYESTYKSIIREIRELDGDTPERIKEDLATIGVPTVPTPFNLNLRIVGVPRDAQFELVVRNADGQVMDRIAEDFGAIYRVGDVSYLMDEAAFGLKKAIHVDYETPEMKIADVQTRARKANATMDEYLQRNTYMQIDDLKLTVNKVADDEIELSLAGESPEENALVRSAMAHANDGMTLRDGFDRTRFALSPKAKKQIEAVRRKPRLKGEEAIQFAVDPNAQMPEGLEDIDLSMFSDRVKGILEIKTIMPHRTSSGIKWIDENGNPVEVDTEELRTWLQNDPDRKFFNVKGKWWFIPSYWRKEILGEEQPDRKIELKLYRLDIAENLEELEYRKSQLEKSFREIPLPYGLEATLFEHQKHGYLWMNHLYEKQSGGLLADDMGLGKTLQVITFFLHLHNQNQLRPSLVVLPKALVENWQNEIRKFAPALSKGLYIHAGSQRLRKKEDIEKAEIIITNYDTLRIDQLEFGKIDFKVIACDEAQNIKSASGQRSHAMRAMKAEFRLAMTGTPVETKLEDLWTIMDFVSPGFLGSLREFNQLYVKPNNTLALRSDILEIYLRRTKKEVLSDQLPTKHPAVISRVPATELQVNLGQALKVQMEDPRTDKDHANKQTDVLEVITKMRQLYSHPNLILPPSESIPIMDTNKMQEMIRICREIRQKGEKVLLFTEFLRMQDILQEAIYHEFGIQAPIINGKTINRTEEVARFNKTIGFNAMILSPKAAGVGLNITSANHVIHFTRWWNPAVENQATDRVYRIGQNRDVYVYHIITEDVVNYVNGTVENHIHDLLDKRQSMADDVIVSYTSDQLIVNELKQKLTKSG